MPKKTKKTWFRLPRWIVVCGTASLLLIVGIVIANAYVAPPPVFAEPPHVSGLQTPTEAPSGVTPAPTPSEQPGMPGNWESIGRREGVYTVLLVGIDGTANTDTIMVAALDAKNKKLDVMNIPRDTQVNVRRGVKKINAAWAAGGMGKEGVEQLKTELKTLIGFTPDYYAMVNLNCFVALVNAIGGVEFDVPMNMNYDDPDQNLHIHLEKGPKHLNGAEAIQLIRFRQNNNGTGYRLGDTERVAVHQEFLKAVAKQTLQLGNLFKIGEFVKIANENLESDLSAGQMLWLAQELLALKEEDINFSMLPVDIGAIYHEGDYALVRQEEALEMINATINPYLAPRTADNLDINRLVDYWRS